MNFAIDLHNDHWIVFHDDLSQNKDHKLRSILNLNWSKNWKDLNPLKGTQSLYLVSIFAHQELWIVLNEEWGVQEVLLNYVSTLISVRLLIPAGPRGSKYFFTVPEFKLFFNLFLFLFAKWTNPAGWFYFLVLQLQLNTINQSDWSLFLVKYFSHSNRGLVLWRWFRTKF